MLDDLKMIKKMYGEDMMHLCRELFSTILEVPGLLYSLMEANFAPSHFLYDDIMFNGKKIDFKNYIYSLIGESKEEVKITKNPFELMNEAGYILYECKSERDIQEFKKYYSPGEELCTFNGGRLNSCHVFFAVKKNVDEIKRKDYKNPERQDEYGTSVISIQFTRGKVNTLSIKNRYNHNVDNPDATFSNNLENIIPGLTASFEKKYRFNINQNEGNGFEIPGYVKANDGKYYKYNYETANRYYCPDNLIIDNFEVIRDYQEKEKYIIVDYYIIDLVNKRMMTYYKEGRVIKDSFIDGFKDIKNIQIVKNKENGGKTIIITPNEGEDIIIEIDKFNRIVGYRNDNLLEIGDYFLDINTVLSDIQLPNVLKIGACFLPKNRYLKKISLPNLKKISGWFLCENRCIEDIDLPNLEFAGTGFLFMNNSLKKISLPKLMIVVDDFLKNNQLMTEVDFPNLTKVGDYFMYMNLGLKSLDLPKVVVVGDKFLTFNKAIRMINMPSLIRVRSDFLSCNRCLRKLELLSLEDVGNYFLTSNKRLLSANIPNLGFAGKNFNFRIKVLRMIRKLK